MKFELAARNGITLPYKTVEEAIAGYNFDSLTSFLVGYYEGMGVLIEEQDFYDLAMAYFRKVGAENLIYAEIFSDPQGHTSRAFLSPTSSTASIELARTRPPKWASRPSSSCAFSAT